MRDVRSVASAALAVAAALLFTYGGMLLYVKQEVADESELAARLVSSLDDSAVREVVSERTVDALLERRGGDLVTVRPLLLATVESLVVTPSFKRVATFGIADTHRALVAGEGSVIVRLERSARLVVGALRSVSPTVASRTSGDLRPVLARIDRDRSVIRIVRGLTERSEWTWPTLALALLAALGALGVARDRRRAVVHLGAALVGAGILLIGAVSVGGRIVTGWTARATSLDGDREREALDAVWTALFGDARTAAFVIALAGLLVVALASGLALDRVRAVSIPRSLRGPALIVVGLGCMVAPGAALRVAVVVGGAFLLLWGAGETASAVQARLDARRPARAGAPSPPGLRSGLLAVAATALVAGSLVAAAAIAFDVPPPPAAASSPREGCNGSRALCDRRVNEVVWPATHNSYAASDQRGWYFANQRRRIARQLDDGITALLLDVHWGVRDASTGRVRTDLRAEGSDRNKVFRVLDPRAVRKAERVAGPIGSGRLEGERALYLCHTLCEIGAEPLDEELAEIRRFLEREPSSVLTIVFEDYVPPARIREALDEAGLLRYAAALDRAAPLPTLGGLIADGRRLLVFAEKEGGAYPWYMPAFSFIQDTPLGNRRPADLRCARWRGDDDSPMLLLNHWIDRFPPRPSDNAPVNRAEFLRSRIERCSRERGVRAGLVAVDFYEDGDVVDLAAELNR